MNICEVARAIKRSGKSTSQAISIAVSWIKRWASGVGVDAKTQAKAAKALAQWEAMKARSHSKGKKMAASESSVDRIVRLADAKKKPYGDVKYADPKNGKYPIDCGHVQAAWAYINKPKNAAVYPLNGVTLSSVKGRIRAAMKRCGHDISE